MADVAPKADDVQQAIDGSRKLLRRLESHHAQFEVPTPAIKIDESTRQQGARLLSAALSSAGQVLAALEQISKRQK